MRFGVHLPNFGPLSDPAALVAVAREAEAAGWDGLFVWDHIAWDNGRVPMADPWIALAAIAASTTRIRLGALITPLARRRPWKVARETVTLDQLSAGRLVLGAGLGWRAGLEFAPFGEATGDRVRAERLDESLAIVDGLWTGEPFSFAGTHYRVDDAQFLPRPVQSPRIPIWIAGLLPHRRPFVRAARWDGAFPERRAGGTPTPAEVAALGSFIAVQRASAAPAGGQVPRLDPFDIVVGGVSVPGRPLAGHDAYAAAGLTWWLERIDPGADLSVPATLTRVCAGPPRPVA
ncbi:MAG TPA: LLM class flavin-dependent oxidoreductase [Solirubrobacteraceae bacterium]|jgi:alkanesulfonate monooxygenase SsuD/methylene tetrahydromethanopterin reductase-like flavin-dependent oxidoreductase (luciferase family)|nr:LLM class flavin-dependent oxidoreductase [Solirubrobacteraceae bacterium]